MNNKDFKQLFDDYYKSVYQRWKINNEKAGKDIVGEDYESIVTGKQDIIPSP